MGWRKTRAASSVCTNRDQWRCDGSVTGENRPLCSTARWFGFATTQGVRELPDPSHEDRPVDPSGCPPTCPAK
jgi:hypothetical protein